MILIPSTLSVCLVLSACHAIIQCLRIRIDFRCNGEHDVSLVEHKNVPCPLPVKHFVAVEVLMIMDGLINHLPVCRVCLSFPCNLTRYLVLSFAPVLLSYSSVFSDFPVRLSILYALCICSDHLCCHVLLSYLSFRSICPFRLSVHPSFLPNCSKIIAKLVLN